MEGDRKCRKRKRPRVPASKHARTLRGRAPTACMRACVRAYVLTCVRACVRAYGERPEGKDATRTRPYTRPRASTRALTCTCTRVNPFPRDNRRRCRFFFFLFIPPSCSSSFFFCRCFLLRSCYIAINYARVATSFVGASLQPPEGLTCDRRTTGSRSVISPNPSKEVGSKELFLRLFYSINALRTRYDEPCPFHMNLHGNSTDGKSEEVSFHKFRFREKTRPRRLNFSERIGY